MIFTIHPLPLGHDMIQKIEKKYVAVGSCSSRKGRKNERPNKQQKQKR